MYRALSVPPSTCQRDPEHALRDWIDQAYLFVHLDQILIGKDDVEIARWAHDRVRDALGMRRQNLPAHEVTDEIDFVGYRVEPYDGKIKRVRPIEAALAVIQQT